MTGFGYFKNIRSLPTSDFMLFSQSIEALCREGIGIGEKN